MEQIKEEIKQYRMISDSSIRIYCHNVKKLALGMTGKEFENVEFLKDTDAVVEQLSDKSLSTKKNYLSSVLVFLNPRGMNQYDESLEPFIKKYTKLLKEYHDEYMEHIEKQHKSAKESKNWVSMDDLLHINTKYKNRVRRQGITLNSFSVYNDKEKLDLLQKYLVSCLYLHMPPRRLEYSHMEIIDKPGYEHLPDHVRESNNFLVHGGRSAKKKFFSFGKYKNRNHMGLQKIPIKSKELNGVLNLWLKHNSSKNFLLDSRGKKMSSNTLSKYLYKVFQEAGVNISATMLRHIYLTEKYGDESSYKEKKDDAHAMAHSVAVQQQYYVKKD